MKKFIALGISFLLTMSFLCAQLSHPHFVSVNFGTNIPLADYKDADSLSGSANTGLYYSFEAGAFFSKVIGIGMTFGAFNNAGDESSIKDQLSNDFTNNSGNFEVSSKDWTNGYIMVGPYLSFGSRKFIVDAKVLAGVINTEKPFVSIESNQDGTKLQTNEVSNTAFGINYGLHFRIKLIGKLALRLNAEGLMSSQEFKSKIENTDLNGNTTSRNETIEKEVQALNLGAGIAINF